MEDEYLWGFVDLYDLCCEFVLFAVGAVPFVSLLELLLFAKIEEAVSKFNSSSVGIVFGFIPDLFDVFQIFELEPL